MAMRAPESARTCGDTVVERQLASVTRLEVPAIPRPLARRPGSCLRRRPRARRARYRLPDPRRHHDGRPRRRLPRRARVSVPAVITVTVAIFYARACTSRRSSLCAPCICSRWPRLCFGLPRSARCSSTSSNCPSGSSPGSIAVPAFALFFIVAAVVRTHRALTRARAALARRYGRRPWSWAGRTGPAPARAPAHAQGFDRVTLVDVGRDERVRRPAWPPSSSGARDDGRPTTGHCSSTPAASRRHRARPHRQRTPQRRRGLCGVEPPAAARQAPAPDRLLRAARHARPSRARREPGRRRASGSSMSSARPWPSCCCRRCMLTLAIAIKLTHAAPSSTSRAHRSRGQALQVLQVPVDEEWALTTRSIRGTCSPLINGEAETKTQTVEGEAESVFKLVDDPRVTGVGRLILRILARRAAATLERPHRRHEPCGTTAPAALRGRAL